MSELKAELDLDLQCDKLWLNYQIASLLSKEGIKKDMHAEQYKYNEFLNKNWHALKKSWHALKN